MLPPYNVKGSEPLLWIFEIHNLRHHECTVSFQNKTICIRRRESHFFKKYTHSGCLNLSTWHHKMSSWALTRATKSKIFINLLLYWNFTIESFIFYSLYQFMGIYLSPCCYCAADCKQGDSTAEWIWLIIGSFCCKELKCCPFSGSTVRKWYYS